MKSNDGDERLLVRASKCLPLPSRPKASLSESESFPRTRTRPRPRTRSRFRARAVCLLRCERVRIKRAFAQNPRDHRAIRPRLLMALPVSWRVAEFAERDIGEVKHPYPIVS